MATKKTMAEHIADEIEAGKQAEAHSERTTESTPEDVTKITVHGDIQYLNLEDVDFDRRWNIRDDSMHDDRVRRKVGELSVDRYIRTPIKVCLMKDAPTAKPRVACGFLRCHALLWLRENDPDFFNEHFYKKIPFEVIPDCTERDRELLMYDHGLEEELTEWEVYKSQKRLMRTGVYTQRAMINILSKMYYKLAGADDRRRYNERLTELQKEGVTIIGSNRIRTVEDMRLHSWRGRFQYFQRIAESLPEVEEHFRKQCHGEKVAKITSNAAQELHKCKTADEVTKYFEQIAKAQEKGEQTARTWGKGKIESVKGVTKSTYLKRQWEAALGDEAAGNALPQMEEELLKIERAMAFAPERFWKAVGDILADADKVVPPAAEK